MVTRKNLMCRYCGTKTIHEKVIRNDKLHFILSFITCGLWLFVWVPYVCSKCGTIIRKNTNKLFITWKLVIGALLICGVSVAIYTDIKKPTREYSRYDRARAMSWTSIKENARVPGSLRYIGNTEEFCDLPGGGIRYRAKWSGINSLGVRLVEIHTLDYDSTVSFLIKQTIDYTIIFAD